MEVKYAVDKPKQANNPKAKDDTPKKTPEKPPKDFDGDKPSVFVGRLSASTTEEDLFKV